MCVPQFGAPDAWRSYPDRPAAFAIVERGGLIACVRVHWRREKPRLDLPGGGIDPGESPAQAAMRECGEEAGLKVAIEGEPLTRADHYFVNDDEQSHNTRGSFFVGRLLGNAPELKTERDHVLEWLEPLDALKQLSRGSHAWALAVWLRGGAA